MSDGIEISIEMPELQAIKAAFKELPTNIAAKHMAAALGRAIEPGLNAIKQLTPRGPTGNLRRSIKKKTKKYTRTGSAVALAGYTAAPRGKADKAKANEKGHHQGLVEFGTKVRRTKDRIASSFGRSGPVRRVVSKRGGKVSTKPGPPKGFVKAVPKGETVDLKTMPIGGSTGVPPIRTAYTRTLPTMSENMKKEMTRSLNNALKEMAGSFRQRGGR